MGLISWLSFTIPKAGNRISENEDAVFPQVGVGQAVNSLPSTFIVSDGATQTSFSGLWAELLTNNCAKYRLSEPNFLRAIEQARIMWNDSFEGKQIPWHAAEKIQQGAFTAVTWVEIQYAPLQPGNAFSWRALAVGDCSLFISRSKSIYLSLPIQNIFDFSNQPTLVPSRIDRISSIKGRIQTAKGSLKTGDLLFLASDALAATLIGFDDEAYLEFIKTLRIAKDTANLQLIDSWMQKKRRSGQLKNDDSTLIFIELG